MIIIIVPVYEQDNLSSYKFNITIYGILHRDVFVLPIHRSFNTNEIRHCLSFFKAFLKSRCMMLNFCHYTISLLSDSIISCCCISHIYICSTPEKKSADADFAIGTHTEACVVHCSISYCVK